MTLFLWLCVLLHALNLFLSHAGKSVSGELETLIHEGKGFGITPAEWFCIMTSFCINRLMDFLLEFCMCLSSVAWYCSFHSARSHVEAQKQESGGNLSVFPPILSSGWAQYSCTLIIDQLQLAGGCGNETLLTLPNKKNKKNPSDFNNWDQKSTWFFIKLGMLFHN